MSQDQNSLAVLKPRRLIRGEITYSHAQKQDANILHELGYRDKRIRFFTHLRRNRMLIKKIIAHHLGLSEATCHLTDVEDWIDGSFNVCIRVDVGNGSRFPGKQFMIRFPLPYKVGEDSFPGNADEKICCEAGTYAWLQENCPEIPIPRLYGYGLSNGQTFTILDNLSFPARTFQYLRRQFLKWLGYPTPSNYIRHRFKEAASLKTGYILIEYVDASRGRMLSDTWEEGRHDAKLRENLFHGLSRVMVALTRIPLPRIGSFILDGGGYLRLNNRPLTLQLHLLENQSIPVDISRKTTHSTVGSYINDIISFHESRFRHQPNSVRDLQDGLYQTCALTIMRSVWPCFFCRDLAHGPFFLTLTDLHQSNILVDDDWNISCLIDLEWACSRPVEMIRPPYWLSAQDVDMIDLHTYETLHKEFVEILEQEEVMANFREHRPVQLSSILKQGWENGTFWCSLALDTPAALFKIFYDYIQPRFSKGHINEESFWLITMAYWAPGAYKFIEQKLNDKKQYDMNLREAFEEQHLRS